MTLPPEMKTLYDGSVLSKHYLANIRRFNSAFGMVSMGGTVNERLRPLPGIYTFRLQGEMYHQIGTLLPQPGIAPAFAQIYLIGPEQQLAQRQSVFAKEFNIDVYAVIYNVLHLYNRMVKTFKSLGEDPRFEARDNFNIVLKLPGPSRDKRILNLPLHPEVAAIMTSDYEGHTRDIIIQSRDDGALRRISDIHPLYEPLAYPLIYVLGESGWQPELLRTIPAHINRDGEDVLEQECTTKLTAMDYACYRLQIRPRNVESAHLHMSKNLFHQWCVDMYVRIESGRLQWLKFNQKSIRADVYRGCQDAIRNGDQNLAQIGKLIVLPSFK
jgi:Helitron helicase-like domain at N-terminus